MKANRDRLIYLRWALVSLFGFAIYSQARLQVFDRKKTLLKAEATHRFTMSRTDKARRGTIYSSDGRPLAQNDDTYSLVIQFDEVPNSDAFFMDLSAATGIPATEFSQLSCAGVGSKTWSQPLSSARQKAVQDLKTKWRANGVSIAPSGQRDYPLGSAASCIIGVSSSAMQLGLEKSLDADLKGSDGKTVGLVDRTGAFLPMRLTGSTIPKTNGKDVELTIDSELQTMATSAIRQAVEENKADRGVAIMIVPSTGDIVAMANWPSFDPTGRDNPPGTVVSDFNPCTMSPLEPGSMFKILTLAKALDMGAIPLDWTGVCNGQTEISGHIIHCSKNEVHGKVDITKAIAESCNVSAAGWALRIGRTEYQKYLRQLEVLKAPGLGLPNEKEGSYVWNDPAEQLELALNGFGQAVGVTPIRAASTFAMIGNHGIRMEPRLIKRVGNGARPTVSAGPMIKPETADEVMKCMEAVIQSDGGTGHLLQIPGYRLAGKTGTAERRGRNRGGYVSNFVGFVPAPDPKVMILVMIDNPTNGKHFGAEVAGPVFLELARAAIRKMGIQPTEPITSTAATPASSSTQPDKTYRSNKSNRSDEAPVHAAHPRHMAKPRIVAEDRDNND